MGKIPDDVWHILSKTILPSMVAVSVGIAVKMQRNKVTVISALGSYIIGVGMAFIFGGAIHENFEQGWARCVIGMVAITGEKIAHWLIFKFEVDAIGQDFVEWLRRKMK